jgi:hypothetical protein
MPINIVHIKVGSREIALKSFIGSVLAQRCIAKHSCNFPFEVYGPSSWTPKKSLHEFYDDLATHEVIFS